MPSTPQEPPHDDPLTLAAFQRHIHGRYHAADAARGTPGTFMWFIEEVGELATTLHKVAGEAPHTSGGSTRADLEGEVADVLAWLCTLANINGIDLSDAVRAKYLGETAPEGHK